MGELRHIAWATPARFDLRRLKSWTERHSPNNAGSQAARIRKGIESLPDNPRLGQRIPVPDSGPEELRELILVPYVIRYIVEPERIVIVRMWHEKERRQQPKSSRS